MKYIAKKRERNHEPFSHHPNIELNQTSVYMLYSHISVTVQCETNVNLWLVAKILRGYLIIAAFMCFIIDNYYAYNVLYIGWCFWFCIILAFSQYTHTHTTHAHLNFPFFRRFIFLSPNVQAHINDDASGLPFSANVDLIGSWLCLCDSMKLSVFFSIGTKHPYNSRNQSI